MTTVRRKPDFLAIGPEKTGTTLLYSVIRYNPQVYMPPYKELKYWNEGEQFPSHNLMTVLTSNNFHYAQIRTLLRRSIVRLVGNSITSVFSRKEINPKLLWNLKFSLGKRNSEWYDSLFIHDERVAGDISPHYYHLSERRIKECYNHNPDMKVIIFIRDPIDRVWSKARMNLLRNKKKSADEFSMDDFHAFSKRVYAGWLPYKETIQRWKSVFDNVHVAMYDELQQNPREWYRKICAFLEVEMNDAAELNRRVNKGVTLDIPNECQKILFQQYGKELRDLGESYGVPDWVKKYEDLAVRFPAG